MIRTVFFPFSGKNIQNLDYLTILMLFLMSNTSIVAQQEELRQMANALYSANAEEFDRKLYNLATRDHGKIRETNPEVIEMLFTSKTKSAETGRRIKVYFTLYAYTDGEECRSASDFWLKHFVKGNTLKPNRKAKVKNTDQYYYILFNAEYILVVDIPCFELDKETWKNFKKTVLKIFEEQGTSALEINCQGEAIWSINAY